MLTNGEVLSEIKKIPSKIAENYVHPASLSKVRERVEKFELLDAMEKEKGSGDLEAHKRSHVYKLQRYLKLAIELQSVSRELHSLQQRSGSSRKRENRENRSPTPSKSFELFFYLFI